MLLLPPPRRPGIGDAFQVLGVSPNASLQEINDAYRWLARMYHPDVNQSPDAREIFLRVNQAYAEATKRGKYARLKLKCDIVEAKAEYAAFLQLVLRTRTLTGIEIPPVSSSDISRRDDGGRAAKLGFAMMFRCPLCRHRDGCDRDTGFARVADFHLEFLRKASAAGSGYPASC